MSDQPTGNTPPSPGPGTGGPKNEVMAILSLIFSIASFVCCLSLLMSIPAVILGHLGKKKIDESNGALTGSGLALAGIIIGYSNIGLSVIGMISRIIFFATGGSDMMMDMFNDLNF